MNDKMLRVYHHLPARIQTLGASLRGAYLRSWRYGSNTNRLVEEAIDREHWTTEQWTKWQQEQLAYILHRAITQVPYYREYWAKHRMKGDENSWVYLENWPILEKETVRQNPRAFVAADCDIRKMFHEHTSGTTGKSLDLWWSRDTVQRWYALSEARWRGWYGVSRYDRWAILGGQLITPTNRRRPPFWVWNAGLNQLYMSSYHLAPDLIPYYLDALRRYRIKYILGYPSSLYGLAQEALRLKRQDLKLTVAITNAEPVFDYQRQAISEAFQCPVRETYGMAEIVAAASECSSGHLHLWPEAGIVEIIKNGLSVNQDDSGDFVCTGLMNEDMPLIRYQLGDRGTLSSNHSTCDCGRNLPMLSSIEGRTDDTLYTKDGRRIGRLDPVFKAGLPVREAQIIQETIDRLRVRYVPTPEYTTTAGCSLIEKIRARMGDVEVVLESVNEIPRTANGKFRAVICNLSAEERKFEEVSTR